MEEEGGLRREGPERERRREENSVYQHSTLADDYLVSSC